MYTLVEYQKLEAHSAFDMAVMTCALFDIGFTYYRSDREHMAIGYLRRALECWKLAVGRLSRATLRRIINAGELCEYLQDYETALAFYQLALTVYEWKVGESHPDKLLTLHDLSTLYRNLGQNDNTIFYCKRINATTLETTDPSQQQCDSNNSLNSSLSAI